MQTRKIIHIDMDAFYAAIEIRENKNLKNKPVIIGGRPEERGVVATCNYIARRFGIHSAMPSKTALKLCPHAILIPPRITYYKQISTEIRTLFLNYTDTIEPLSLDEAYLDVSHSPQQKNSATLIAKHLLTQITKQTQLTASAGISYNKMLAKIASEINKPNGYYCIPPDQGATFSAQLAIEKFHGIGRKTAEKMHERGLYTGADLIKFGEKQLIQHFGKIGYFYHQIAQGIDHRPVTPLQQRKSIAQEETFTHDLKNTYDLQNALETQITNAYRQLQKHHLKARTLSIKIKYHDFKQITRSASLNPYYLDLNSSIKQGLKLLEQTPKRPIRLIGAQFSNFITTKQSTLF